MYVYRLLDEQDKQCKFIWYTDDLEAGIAWQGSHRPELLSSTWRAEIIEVKTIAKAKKRVKELIRLYQPIYNIAKKERDDKGERIASAEIVQAEDVADEEAYFREAEQADLEEEGILLPLGYDSSLDKDNLAGAGEKKEKVDTEEWKFYRTFDFVGMGGDERHGSARITILVLAAMSGGLVSKEICKAVCKTPSYYSKVMRLLKEKEEAKTVFGKSPRMLHIQQKGCEAIEELLPGTIVQQKKNNLNMNSIERKYDMGMTLYIQQCLGAEILPSRKPMLFNKESKLLAQAEGIFFYTPTEFKHLSMEELRRSRCTGILLHPKAVYIFYHMGERNMKFPVVPERQVIARLQKLAGTKKVKQVLLGKSVMLEQILENGRIKEKMIKGSTPFDRVTPELDMTFIPTDDFETAVLHMKLLLYGQERMKKLEKYIRESDGLISVSTLPLHLWVLKRLATAETSISVICSEAQEEFLRHICPKAVAHPIRTEKLEELIR